MRPGLDHVKFTSTQIPPPPPPPSPPPSPSPSPSPTPPTPPPQPTTQWSSSLAALSGVEDLTRPFRQNVGWEPPSFTLPPLLCPKHCCFYRLARHSGTDKLYPFSFQALESHQALKRRVVRLLGDGRHGVQGPRRGRSLELWNGCWQVDDDEYFYVCV